MKISSWLTLQESKFEFAIALVLRGYTSPREKVCCFEYDQAYERRLK